jgi:hypothetical protein
VAHIDITFVQTGERVWVDTYNWNFVEVSDLARLAVTSLSSAAVQFTTNYDPYAFASTPNPAFGGLSLTGTGFGAPDAAGFPTQGTVTDAVLTSALNGVKLAFSGLDQPARSGAGDWLLGGQGDDRIDASLSRAAATSSTAPSAPTP